MPTSLVIVEDDQPLREFLTGWLKEEGYLVSLAANGLTGLKLITSTLPDLVILDLGLPDIDGETLLKQIKTDWPELPVVVLTAKNKVSNIAAVLNLGADDYLAKPFNGEELLARIRARLRNGQDYNPLIKLADLVIDTAGREVRRQNKLIPLTKTEYELLLYLAKQSGQVVSRETILNHVWGFDKDVESRVVDVYIGYLRQKIDRPFLTKLIRNHRGVGYSLVKVNSKS